MLMKRNALVLTLVLTLIASAAGGAIIFHRTRADPYIAPEQPPSGYRIYSNGTCDAPNLRQDGNLYTFTSDIQGTIVIERDGIVLDGANHTLYGDGSSHGIWLQDKGGVTIKNLNIKNFDNGIRFTHYIADWYAGETNPKHPANCTIRACNITNNVYGISLHYSFNCSVIGNYIAHNTYGLYLYGSDNILRNNKMAQNQYNFWEVDDNVNDVDASNLINGKPIYYWVDRHNLKVPAGAGAVILKHCSGITVQNLNLSQNGNGLSLYYTNNSEIIDNVISDNYWRGIEIWWSNNNSIIGNHITNTQDYGIEIYDSHNNTYSHNLIKNNECGIYNRKTSTGDIISSNQVIGNKRTGIDAGSDSTITKNYVASNGAGILARSNCLITENNITQNELSGLALSSNCLVMSNYISKNNIGIIISTGTKNTITLNSIVENVEWGIKLAGYGAEPGEAPENNFIFKNNFINNNGNGKQAYVKNVTFWGTGPSETHELPGPANSWDDGAEGNYWSDHYGDGIYYINENNQDNHPLLEPMEFTALEIPYVPSPQVAETPTDPTANPTTEPTPDSTFEPEPFPAMIVAVAFAATAIVVSAFLLSYFKKRKR